MIEAKRYYDKTKDILGLPQAYKGISFYPLMLKDLEFIKTFAALFTYPKNTIPDVMILKMSYLKFVLFILRYANKEENVKDSFISFMEHVTRKPVKLSFTHAMVSELGYINDIDKVFHLAEDIELLDIVLRITIGDVNFDEYDFDIMREIILEQNNISIEYVNEYDKSLEELLKKANHKFEDLDLEDEILSFCCALNVPLYDIVDKYTLYQFKNHFKRMMLYEDYRMYKPLEASGQIKLKSGEISHYFKHLGKQGRYESILINEDKFFNENNIFKLNK